MDPISGQRAAVSQDHPSSDSAVLTAGKTCWRVAPADRVAVIVDGQDYFKAVKRALLLAEHSILLIGWDFDTRVIFEPENPEIEGPNKLGAFLNWLAERRPNLTIDLIRWRFAFAQTFPRRALPMFLLDWISRKNVHLRLDGTHPAGAAHHQKIVVVDDSLAFVGGIDMTIGRWDTRRHERRDPRRKAPGGGDMLPWHDAAVLMDGDAARTVAGVARERLHRGTNLRLPEVRTRSIWPVGIQPTFREVNVGVARTWPKREPHEPAYEIEALYLAAIEAARTTIYIESQYFASRKIAEAIFTRLREEDGPEVVMVLPRHASGWLQSAIMDSARSRLLRLARRAGENGRFACYFPRNESGEAIYVHAKIMIVDDRLLRIGSSNLNNRSMGFDTECDVAIEAGDNADSAELRRQIIAVRNDLLGEHLGATSSRVGQEIEKKGTLIGAINALATGKRSLVPMPIEENNALEDALAENDLTDPERPDPLWKRLARAATRSYDD